MLAWPGCSLQIRLLWGAALIGRLAGLARPVCPPACLSTCAHPRRAPCLAPAAGLLTREAVMQQRQQLLSELYRRTGPAKIEDAAAHIRKLLEEGEW